MRHNRSIPLPKDEWESLLNKYTVSRKWGSPITLPLMFQESGWKKTHKKHHHNCYKNLCYTKLGKLFFLIVSTRTIYLPRHEVNGNKIWHQKVDPLYPVLSTATIVSICFYHSVKTSPPSTTRLWVVCGCPPQYDTPVIYFPGARGWGARCRISLEICILQGCHINLLPKLDGSFTASSVR